MALTLDNRSYGPSGLEYTHIWINEDIAGSPPLQLPSYLRDRIEGRKRKIQDSKTDHISLAEAKRKAILDKRVRRLSDQADHVKKTVEENVQQQKALAEQAIKRINARLKRAECKRSRRLNSISVRCKKKVADAKRKRLDNIKKQTRQQNQRLEAINEKLAAGIARRNSELRNKQLRSLAACRWCAARRIQVWWHIMMLKKRFKEFLEVCPKELRGGKQPETYYDLRRILISRNNIRATANVLDAIYKFNRCWARKAGPRILLTAFMIKYFPRSVLAYNGDLERNLMEKGEKLVEKFRELIKQQNMHYRLVYQSILSFGVCWGQYCKALDEWKCVDIDRLLDELHRYWASLQEVKAAMQTRADTARAEATTAPGEQVELLEGDIADSNAVLQHIISQEQMVVHRLEQLGGAIAVQELHQKFSETLSEDQSRLPHSQSRARVCHSPPPARVCHSPVNAAQSDTEMPEEEEPVPQEPVVESKQQPETTHPEPEPQKEEEEEEETPDLPSDEFYEDMAKMEMAHEIVMNSEYKIEKPQSSGLQQQIESTMKEAFWDLLRADVSSEPPNYQHCVSLLAEIRGQIESIGTVEKLPVSHPFRVLIADTLDIDLIQQQIEHDTFSLSVKVEGIINILLKLCSESQDTQIRAILHLTDVVQIFKELFDAVEKIKLEIANYYLQQAKNTIKQHSVEYERSKFQEFLQTHPSGLDNTKVWLQENVSDSPMSTMSRAYLNLLSASPGNPETVALDKERFSKLGSNLRTILICSILNLKLGSHHPNFAEVPFLTSVQDTIKILVPWDSDPAEQRDLVLHKVADLCCKKVPGCEVEELKTVVNNTMDIVLGEDTSDQLYTLLFNRLSVFLTDASVKRRPQFPRGFDLARDMVLRVAELYVKLVDFNRQVYGPFYARLLKEIQSNS